MALSEVMRDGAVVRDVKAISLVSAGHFCSHFFQLALPPLFPLLIGEFNTTYTALGLLMTASALTGSAAETPLGFLVDRFGARWILVGGLVLHSLAIMAMGFADTYWALLTFFMVAGLANSVYHPADYSLLSATVDPKRLGRALSLHTFVGNIGWVLVPIVMVALTAIWGWREALMTIGVFGLFVALCIATLGGFLREEKQVRAEAKAAAPPGATTATTPGGIALLLSPPILMGFLFFMMISAGTGGLRTFSVSALVAIYDAPLEAAGKALTGFLIGSSVGILAGGLIADRFRQPQSLAMIGFMGAAVCAALVGLVTVPIIAVVALLTIAGFCSGAVQPARDLLVRAITPKGSMGKVFGFLSSGLGLGGALVGPFYGWIMDNSDPRWVFLVSAIIIMASVVTVGGLGRAARKKASEEAALASSS